MNQASAALPPRFICIGPFPLVEAVMKMLRVKRIYDAWTGMDGYRILIDRLWPRGVSRESAKLDEWARDIAPSSRLRKEYHQGNLTWDAFALEYGKELDGNSGFGEWAESLCRIMRTKAVTLVTATKLHPHSHVEVLRAALTRNRD